MSEALTSTILKATTYCVGDKVLWTPLGSRGPIGTYLIAKIVGAESYLLCNEDGSNVNNGVAVPEEQLMLA